MKTAFRLSLVLSALLAIGVAVFIAGVNAIYGAATDASQIMGGVRIWVWTEVLVVVPLFVVVAGLTWTFKRR